MVLISLVADECRRHRRCASMMINCLPAHIYAEDVLPSEVRPWVVPNGVVTTVASNLVVTQDDDLGTRCDG